MKDATTKGVNTWQSVGDLRDDNHSKCQLQLRKFTIARMTARDFSPELIALSVHAQLLTKQGKAVLVQMPVVSLRHPDELLQPLSMGTACKTGPNGPAPDLSSQPGPEAVDLLSPPQKCLLLTVWKHDSSRRHVLHSLSHFALVGDICVHVLVARKRLDTLKGRQVCPREKERNMHRADVWQTKTRTSVREKMMECIACFFEDGLQIFVRETKGRTRLIF
eukprot:7151901-Alexandrium_andersonii.AAC.1